MNYYPTKENLINDYYEFNLNHQQISEKYGFKTRQVIHRLFKKYNIKSKSKKEISKQIFNTKHNLPSKQELENLYQNKSISQISKIYNIHRNTLSKLMDEYGIEKTYFKNKIDNNILKHEASNHSLKELSIKYSIDIRKLKNRLKEIPFKLFTYEKVINIFSLYDIHSPSFARDVREDPNLYNSIIELTKNHQIQSNKIIERIYRIIHNIEPGKVFKCKKCNSDLKFYTLNTGYGNTEHKICKNCITSLSGVSKPSQELFWILYKKLSFPIACNFSELNYEKTIYINEDDKLFFHNHKKLNKKRYHIDFIFDNKIIEYNGEFWHKDKEKEIVKNKFLKRKGLLVLTILDSHYKKDPEKVINRCINFLTK